MWEGILSHELLALLVYGSEIRIRPTQVETQKSVYTMTLPSSPEHPVIIVSYMDYHQEVKSCEITVDLSL